MARRLFALVAGTAALALGLLGATVPAQAGTTPKRAFVTRSGSDLRVSGAPFQFAGTNNYYLMYQSPADGRRRVRRGQGGRLHGAADLGLDRHRQRRRHRTRSAAGPERRLLPVLGRHRSGLQRRRRRPAAARLRDLDAPRQAGIKLVIPFTNNWSDFGGMDQYVRWRGGCLPRRLLHRPDDPGLVPGLDLAPAQPGQHADRAWRTRTTRRS